MVHGGGHHSHGGGGGGGHHNRGGGNWGAGNHHNHHRGANNVVIVNNQNSNRQYNRGAFFWPRPPRRNNVMVVNGNTQPRFPYNNNDDDCCNRFWRGCCCLFCSPFTFLWWCLCCCFMTPREEVHVNNTARSVAPSQTRDIGTVDLESGTTCNGSAWSNVFCFGPCLSMALLVILFIMSGRDDEWTLNAGETRRVYRPSFNSAIHVATYPGPVDVLVYDLKNRDCPNLTGPTTTLDDDSRYTLGAEDYQYDYFYLNAGSSIDVSVIQNKGATNVYLLQGSSQLQSLEDDDSSEDDDGFRNHAILNRFVSSGKTASLKYQAKSDNTYIIVYDNASTQRGNIEVKYHVTLTNYNLAGQTPSCSGSDSDCIISTLPRLLENECIIVQATTADNQKASTDDIVTIRVAGRRDWFSILLFSFLPFLLVVFGNLFVQNCRRGNYYYEGIPNNPPATAPGYFNAPMAPTETETVSSYPPATAPWEPAQAVAVEQDFGSIPVVTSENVIPVPLGKF